MLQHWPPMARLLSYGTAPGFLLGVPVVFCCLFFSSFLAKALKISFTFIKVLAHVSMNSRTSMCLCILELHSLLVGQIVLVSHQSDDNAGAGLLLQLLHPVPGL